MRDWLGKPLLILAAILALLGVMSVSWLLAGPSAAAGDEHVPDTAYRRQVDRLIRQIESGR